MKSYSPALIEEKKKQAVTTFYLVKIGTYCFTDCNETIVYNNETFTPWPVKIDGIVSRDGSPLDTTRIIMSNVDLSMSSFVLNGLFDNKSVYIYEAWFDSNMSIIGTDLLFVGKVDGRPSLTELECTITVAPHLNPWTQRFPRRRITKSLFPFLPQRGKKFIWGNVVITIK
jgi:hypothetical protein